MNYDTLKAQLITDEGMRLRPYKDSVGKLTIGVGRNLDDVGISRAEADILLNNDIQVATHDLDRTLSWWRGMSDVRQNVIINMCFNMGIAKLMEFRKALAAMQAGNYGEAAAEMKNSEWYEEVGGRAIRLCSLMENGQ